MTTATFRRAIAGVLTPAIILAWGPVASAQVEDEGRVGIRLVEAPVERAQDPRAHLYVIDHVEQGTTFTRHVEVSNTTSEALDVDLYAASGEVSGGRFHFGEDRSANELTRWITVRPSSLEVPAGGVARAAFTIAVPMDAPDGERYAVIWAEPPAGSAGPVQIVNRVGVRIYLSVGRGEEPSSDFEVRSLTAMRDASGSPAVEAEIVNTGGRALDVTGDLFLSDGPAGLSAGPFRSEPGTTIGIGQSGPMIVLLDPALPDGPWRARLVARSGLIERTAEATIVFPEAAGEASDAVEAEPVQDLRRWLVPLAVGLLLLMLIALVLFFLWWRRRKDEEEDEERRRAAITGNGEKPVKKREKAGTGKR